MGHMDIASRLQHNKSTSVFCMPDSLAPELPNCLKLAFALGSRAVDQLIGPPGIIHGCRISTRALGRRIAFFRMITRPHERMWCNR